MFPGFHAIGLATPEQGGGLFGLSLDQSIDEGVNALNIAITQTYAGKNLVVLGYSQSTVIADLEMNALQADGNVNPSSLRFVLLGANVPNGGLAVREFGGTAGINPNTPFPTDIYTIQYDGLADFPRYPIDILADINAGSLHRPSRSRWSGNRGLDCSVCY